MSGMHALSTGMIHRHLPKNNDRLSAIVNTQFFEYCGDVRFYRGFGNAELVADLLVQPAFAQEAKHAILLRSKPGYLCGNISFFISKRYQLVLHIFGNPAITL